MKKIFYSITVIIFILSLNLNRTKCQTTSYSTINIHIINNSFKKFPPVFIWFNDSLIFYKDVTDYYYIRYRMLSKGNLKINAQIGKFNESLTEYSLNITNDSCYNIIIHFDNAKYPGSIFCVKNTIDKTYEPYFEENIFIDNNLFENYFAQNYSSNYLLLKNTSYQFEAPIKIWINDQIIVKNILPFSNASKLYCRLFAEGKVKISAQLGHFANTKTETEIEISSGETNYITISFNNKDEKGVITLQDKKTGLSLLPAYLETWTLSELSDSNSDLLVESITDPIPGMLDTNMYMAMIESLPEKESLISENIADNYKTSQINYNYKTAKDMIVRSNGDTIYINRIKSLQIEENKLKMTYITDQKQEIKISLFSDDIDKVIIDVYNDPLISQDVYSTIDLQYLILDTVLFNSLFYSLDNSPYLARMRAEIFTKSLITGIFGGLFIGPGAIAIVYGIGFGNYYLAIEGALAICTGWIIRSFPRANGNPGDKFYTKYTQRT